MLGRAGEEGQRLRLEAAETGRVTWQTPHGLEDFLSKDEPDSKGKDDATTAADPDDETRRGDESSSLLPEKEQELDGSHDL